MHDRRREAVRRALSHAAIELATARGSVETVSVDEIARAGQVSRRTFFNYFPTKSDAVAWPLAVFRRRLLAELTVRPASEPIWAALEAAALLALTDPATDLTDLHRAGLLIRTSTVRTLEEQIATRTAHTPEGQIATRTAHTPEGQIATRTAHTPEGQIAARTGTDPAAGAYPQLVAAMAGAGIQIAIARWATHGGAVDDHLAHTFALIRSGLPDPRGAR